MKKKRSQIKLYSIEAKILRYMRMSKRISMKEAGRRNGCSDSAIAHYEQGRMGISSSKIGKFVESYGFTESEWLAVISGKPLPVISIKDECFELIDRLDETKLRAVHALLQSFGS